MKLLARRWLRHWRRPVLMLAACVVAQPAIADDPRHEVLLFTSIDAFDNFDVSNADARDTFVRPALDGLYSYSGERFRVLAEYLWSSEESELERLKIGWQLGDNTMVWFGRMHATSKYWTSEYHHGQFTQTPITRPSVEEWEDESGPLPSHITGISLEHSFERADESVISLSATAGFAPRFVHDRLEPYPILNPESDHHGSAGFKLAYRPDVFSRNQFGLTVSWNDFEVDQDSDPALTDLAEIEQLAYGVYGDWTWDKWRLLGSVVRFENNLRYDTGEVHDDFASGYLQVEYQVSGDWTLFARSDNAEGEDHSPFLHLLPSFVAHRQMAGVRWDFRNFQALTLELAEVSRQGDDFDHDNFKEVRMQWSAVFP